MAAHASALVLFWAATLAKASAVVLPALLLVYALAVAPDRRRALSLLVPFAVLAAALAMVALAAGHASGALKVRTASTGAVALSALKVVGASLHRTLLPVGLSPRYPPDISAWLAAPLAAVCVAGLVAAAFLHRRLVVAMAWFAVALLPYLNLVRTSTQQADRYLYVAAGGFAMVLGLAVESARRARWRTAAACACALVLAAYAGLSLRQSRVWSSSERLWERALHVAPDDPIALFLMADHLVMSNQPRRAAPLYRRAADGPVASAERHRSKALAARACGDARLATRHEALAEQFERTAADALALYARALWWPRFGARLPRSIRVPDAALKAHREAVRLGRGEPRFHLDLAFALTNRGRPREAVVHYLCAARGADDVARLAARTLVHYAAELDREGHADLARSIGPALEQVAAHNPAVRRTLDEMRREGWQW
jgi:tetratricopeptide (TPR) repeat protein